MKHLYLFILALYLLATTGCNPVATTGRVSGRAIWPDTGEAVPEVEVTLLLDADTDNEVKVNATTDAEGTYTFSELKPGSYTPSLSLIPDTLDSPCSNFSVHPSMGENWFNVMGAREDGRKIFAIVSMTKIDIAAGDDLQLGFEFKCK